MARNVGARARSEGASPSGDASRRRIVPVANGQMTLKRCRAFERKLARQITRAVQRGALKEARSLADLYMKSSAAMVVAIHDADKKLRKLERKQLQRSGSQRPGRQALTPQEAVELAAETSPYVHCGETATAWHESKPAGGFRIVMNFGIQKRAMQLMVKRVLMPFFDPHPGQYILRGGRPAACAAVRDALESGFKWAVHADVRDCFGSLGHEGLLDILPIPVRVIQNVVFCDGSDVVPVGEARLECLSRIRRLAGDQRSIPQGSSASGIVAEIALKPLLGRLPGRVFIVNYGDNIQVLTRTRAEALAIKELLASTADQVDVGPLELNKWRLKRVADGFPFLGYQFRMRGGVFSATPCEEKLRLKVKLFQALILAQHDSREIINDIISWARQYPLWEHARTFERFWVHRANEIDVRRADRWCRWADAAALRKVLRTRYHPNHRRPHAVNRGTA
jgi:hypothetical protein